jgi:hypothetical protein
VEIAKQSTPAALRPFGRIGPMHHGIAFFP